jgi:hypothetical protein
MIEDKIYPSPLSQEEEELEEEIPEEDVETGEGEEEWGEDIE